MRARENAQADDLNVLLQGRGGDHLRSLKQTRVDDLEAGVAERSHEDLCAAVVTIESGFGDQDADRRIARVADVGFSSCQADQVVRGAPCSVLEKALSGLTPELPGADHAPQQRSRTVLVIPEVAVQRLQDVEADVETNQVGQRQRTHRVRHTELHHLVDRLRRKRLRPEERRWPR